MNVGSVVSVTGSIIREVVMFNGDDVIARSNEVRGRALQKACWHLVNYFTDCEQRKEPSFDREDMAEEIRDDLIEEAQEALDEERGLK